MCEFANRDVLPFLYFYVIQIKQNVKLNSFRVSVSDSRRSGAVRSVAPCVRRQRTSFSLAASPRLLSLLIPTATGPVRPAASASAAAASHGAHAAPLFRTGRTNINITYTFGKRLHFTGNIVNSCKTSSSFE